MAMYMLVPSLGSVLNLVFSARPLRGEYIFATQPKSSNRENPLRSPLRSGFSCLVAYLRNNGGDRFCWKPARALPFACGLPSHRQPEGCRSRKINERWPQVTTMVDSEPRRTQCPTSPRPRALSKNTLRQRPILLRCLHQSRRLFLHRQSLQ